MPIFVFSHDGYVEDPDYEDDRLYETVGYCTRLWVSREHGKDTIGFRLRIYRDGADYVERDFVVYFYMNPPTAAAQLQSLRDALDAVVRRRHHPPRAFVRVHFNFEDLSKATGIVYWLGVEVPDDLDVVTATTYFSERYGASMVGGSLGWYTHIEGDS